MSDESMLFPCSLSLLPLYFLSHAISRSGSTTRFTVSALDIM